MAGMKVGALYCTSELAQSRLKVLSNENRGGKRLVSNDQL
jgi:hypothetical protein